MKKETFNIQGMTCSSCSSHVDRAVRKLEGIKNVNVNLLSNSMVVEYNEKLLDTQKIIKAVEEVGYGASLQEKKKDKTSPKTNNVEQTLKAMKKRLIISIIFLIPLMYIAMYHMFYEWFGLPIPHFVENIFHGNENAINFAFTQFLLLLPIVYVNRNFFIVGFKRLFKASPNMDSLIAIGSSAAIVYGIYAIYMIGYGLGHGDIDLVQKYTMDIYFESAGTILTLITLGKYLETKSKSKTSDAISKLINLVPKTAIVLKNDVEVEVQVENILKDDIVIVKPGNTIPVDGIIIEGSSYIDQSSITGESIPVEKVVQDGVVSGTINKNGYLKIKATKVGEDTTISQIIRLVEEASNSKAPISKLADKVSGIFVPCVIAIAVLATIIWLIVGKPIEFALSIGIAVLVISCPCALGLATPVAIMVGTGKGAELGILIKSAESLELLHSVDAVVLDKTGTITEGKPKVTDVYSENNEELLKIAASIEKKSEHPLGEAVVNFAEEKNIKLQEIEDFQAVAGRGIKAKIKSVEYYGGNRQFMEENNIDINTIKEKSEELLKQGKTVLYFSKGNKLLGIIAVADVVKKDSYEAIQSLKNKNIETIMLTGDNKLVAENISKQLEIDKVISEVMPQDKEREISNLQKLGKKVAFVGDGINDSPALARADVGIAIGSGTDIAIESADIILVKNSLLDVVSAIDLSKAVIKNIKMNLFWAFFYNAIGIPVAAGIFYNAFGLKLNPMIGAAAMSLSSVCVVTNALRLKNFKSKKYENNNIENVCDEKCEISNKKLNKEENFMKTIVIEGMQCNHCKMSVEKALKEIEGVNSVDVSLEEKQAKIDSNIEIDNNKIKEAIENIGFTVKEIK